LAITAAAVITKQSKNMKVVDRESNSGKIIRALGMGVGIAVALSNQGFSFNLSKELVKKVFGSDKSKRQLYSYFYGLRKQKLIEIKKCGEETQFFLTENGQEIMLRFSYEDMSFKKPTLWDRNFRLIIFDIPESKKYARDSMRQKMKELGCVKFNDSVWIYPFPCQSEVDFIANYWKLGKYVHFALVKDITNRDLLEKHFKL
jgi:DNA-binding transcriptional regulator PaaX